MHYHSISTGEVTSSNKEILSACCRYVKENLGIKQAFLNFLEIERITDKDPGKTLLDFYERTGIDVKQCSRTRFDGAPNKQSQRKRTTSYILSHIAIRRILQLYLFLFHIVYS